VPLTAWPWLGPTMMAGVDIAVCPLNFVQGGLEQEPLCVMRHQRGDTAE